MAAAMWAPQVHKESSCPWLEEQRKWSYGPKSMDRIAIIFLPLFSLATSP